MEALQAIRTAFRTRADDPDWFDGLREIAAADRPATAAIESSSVVYRIDSTAEDPRDLGHTLPLARIQSVRGVGRGRLEPYVPDENAPQVNLNNDGLVLVIDALDP